MTMKKEIIDRYENLLKDACHINDSDYHINEWQIDAMDFCLDQIANNHPDKVNLVRLRYGLDSGIRKTYKECANVFKITINNARDHVAKILRCLNHPTRRRMLLEEGYIDFYLCMVREREAREERDIKLGNIIGQYFDVFEDVHGYVNYDYGNLNISEYKSTLGTRATCALERGGIKTFKDLLNANVDDFDHFRNIGPTTIKNIKDFLPKLKEFDDDFKFIKFRIDVETDRCAKGVG